MKQKKIITIDEYLDSLEKNSKKEKYAIKYKQSVSTARAGNNDSKLIEDLNLKTGNYSLRTKILKNPWVNQRPASKAIEWLFKTVFKDSSTYRYGKSLIYQGGFFFYLSIKIPNIKEPVYCRGLINIH